MTAFQRSPWTRMIAMAPLLIGIAVVAFGFITPVDTLAQTASSNPPSLTVAGTLGDPPQERVLFISASTPVSGVEVLVSDFVRTDNAATLTGLLSVAPPPQRVEAGKPLTLTVTISFAQARSGAYNGTIWVNYDAGGIPASLQIPVTVTIKDPPWPPFLTLIAGVAVAALISTYLGGGRQRDDLAVRIERLAARVMATSGLPDSVRRTLRQELNLAEAWLRASKLDDALQAYNRAEQLLTRWLGWLEPWRLLHEQLDRARTLLQPDAQGKPAYAVAIHRRLREIEESAPATTDLNSIQESLNGVIAQINDFLHLDTRCKNLQTILDATALTPAEKSAYQAQIDQLARRIETLLPEAADNRPNYNEIDQALSDLNQRLKAHLPKGAPESALLGGQAGQAAMTAAVFEAIAPQFPRLTFTMPHPEQKANREAAAGWSGRLPWARIRLYGFRLAQFLILITLWGWTGYNELYIQNPTFGSDWMSNYFTLLAWGFTSEAARATFTSLAGRVGLSVEQG
ncbi:MAG: hypothetical protein K6T87_02435 [Roseiflexus sp.]|uniref:hypothetical protein n=1 Tax=Roseiflexus sp. TaxID=2562120 RepID=UPI0025E9636F|nr:hypothetical protein [Roseiflexus sp.]MCL6539444.1 hypothetical protein [Roseiflexus sp.]